MLTEANQQPGSDAVKPVRTHLFTFPPFPHVPEGAHVISFEAFEERGISTAPGPEEEEVDTLGVPTLVMRVAHSTDVCKTKTERKKPVVKQTRTNTLQVPWWEVWQQTEMIRITKCVDPRFTRAEQMQSAITDFTKNRTWPPQIKAETGPKYLWEKFLRFIGLPEGYLPITAQIQNKKKKKEQQAEEEDDDAMSIYSDDDFDLPECGIDDQADDQNSAVMIDHTRVLTNEEKLHLFLVDPVKAISVFMTSHSWNKGYIWSEENLMHIPRLLDFLISFLLRSKVFPDLEQEYRHALEITKAGLIQLPNCARFMKAVPDKFSAGCTGYWGRKTEAYKLTDLETFNSLFPEEPHVESRNEAMDAKSSAADDGWGGGDSTWGVVDNDDANAWSSDQLERLAWETEKKQPPTLEEFGLTDLPLTHTTGVVERSMRLIKSIHMPNNNTPPPQTNESAEGGPNPNAVEIKLDRSFGRIHLAPMPDWDHGEAPVYSSPTIMETSRGLVIGDGAHAGTGLKPHDPKNDDIIVLMECQHASMLREGMGVAGTWVQVVRESPQKVKKKGKKKAVVYWYLEEVAFVTPTFWTFYD